MNKVKKKLLEARKKDKRCLKKFGIKNLLLKNNSKFYVKLLKSEHLELENRIAQKVIDINKKLLSNESSNRQNNL